MSDSFIKTCKKGSCNGLMSVKKIPFKLPGFNNQQTFRVIDALQMRLKCRKWYFLICGVAEPKQRVFPTLGVSRESKKSLFKHFVFAKINCM